MEQDYATIAGAELISVETQQICDGTANPDLKISSAQDN